MKASCSGGCRRWNAAFSSGNGIPCREQHQAGIRHLRVVENTAVVGDLLESGSEAQACTVGPVETHRLNHVGHTQDPFFHQQLIAGQGVRVSTSVDVLVVFQVALHT
jgi:hypothetical protein